MPNYIDTYAVLWLKSYLKRVDRGERKMKALEFLTIVVDAIGEFV
jgi:hypothetical protein